MSTEEPGGMNAALVKAQRDFPPIHKSREVQVRTRTGGTFAYSYAPLDAILGAVRPVLADNGLALIQLISTDTESGRPCLVTELRHISGEAIGAAFAFEAPADPQALGSLLTYLRRYAVTAILGLAAETDDDGQAADSPDTTPGKIPAEVAPTNAQWAELGALISELSTLDPDTDWNDRARDISGVSGEMLTRHGAEFLAEELAVQRDRLRSEAGANV